MKELWVDKYRPKSIAEYVFRDDHQKKQIQGWIGSGAIPHLLFSGPAGTGKTTLAKVLLSELKVDDGDVLEINASLHNSIDDVRNKIYNWVTTLAFGEFKYVLLDEVDYFSHNAQASLRNLIENNSSNARFILTCNAPNKIMTALHSRCQGFHINKLDGVEFTTKMAEILLAEGIDFELEVLDSYVKATYPDMRKCLNLLQPNSMSGKLLKPNEVDSGSTKDFRLEVVDLFKKQQYKKARELICAQITQDEYEEMYRFMYTNTSLWSNGNEDKDNEVILAIRSGLVKHATVADIEINLSATLIELEMIARQ